MSDPSSKAAVVKGKLGGQPIPKVAMSGAISAYKKKASGPVGWDLGKVTVGQFPPNFTASDATTLVNSAPIADAVFVNTSNTKETRQAYIYQEFEDSNGHTYRICVVQHCHIDPGTSAYSGQGRSFIPGFANWDMSTPATQAQNLATAVDSGTYPDAARFPVLVK